MAYIEGNGDNWRLWLRPTAEDVLAHVGHKDVTEVIAVSAQRMIERGLSEARYSLHREGVTQWTMQVPDEDGAHTEYLHMLDDGTVLEEVGRGTGD